ncbi:MAG: hypothetical protein WD847_19555 [Pirellulales bacterium]
MRGALKGSLLLAGCVLAGGVFATPPETATQITTPPETTDEGPAAAGLIANGDFDGEPTSAGRPAGWYFLHQARLARHGEDQRQGHLAQPSVPAVKDGDDESEGGRHIPARGSTELATRLSSPKSEVRDARYLKKAIGGNYLSLANAVPGRDSQAQQAFALDGRKTRQLDVSFWTRAKGVRPGQSIEQRPQLAISFFDESKSLLGREQVGPWFGSFDWQRKEGTFVVPPATRIGIVWVGLFGGTGEAAFDSIEIRAAEVNPSIFTPAPE